LTLCPASEVLPLAIIGDRVVRGQPIAAFARMELQVYSSRGERGPLPHKDSPKSALIFL